MKLWTVPLSLPVTWNGTPPSHSCIIYIYVYIYNIHSMYIIHITSRLLCASIHNSQRCLFLFHPAFASPFIILFHGTLETRFPLAEDLQNPYHPCFSFSSSSPFLLTGPDPSMSDQRKVPCKQAACKSTYVPSATPVCTQKCVRTLILLYVL